jgi:hypothetical protein
MKARKIIEGELRNIGFQDLSNNGIDAPIISFSRHAPPLVDIPPNIRYIFRVRAYIAPSKSLPKGASYLIRQGHAETSR